MTHENPDELTPAERDALASLPKDAASPPWLEERVVGELIARGQIVPRRPARRWFMATGALAASILLFAAGLAGGRYLTREPAPPPPGPRFMLLLYEDAGYIAAGPGGFTERVAEYTQWARELGEKGRFVSGEKLKDAAEIVSLNGELPPGEPGFLAGYFMITASGPQEAAAVARECPHLRHGGTIVVREIDPV